MIHGPLAHNLLDRGWVVAMALAAGVVLGTSAVGLNLWIASGPIATVFVVAYIGTLAGIALRPDDVRAHGLAAGLAVLVWGGRAAAFLDLVVESNRWDLWGAVAERAALLAAALTLHFLAARRIAHTQVLSERGILPRPADG